MFFFFKMKNHLFKNIEYNIWIMSNSDDVLNFLFLQNGWNEKLKNLLVPSYTTYIIELQITKYAWFYMWVSVAGLYNV